MNSFQKVMVGALLVCGSVCATAQIGISKETAGVFSPNGPGPIPSNGPVNLTNSATSFTGTILHKELKWNSKIPLNKTYDQFSPEEKAELAALYETMPPGDEPPFPVQGMRPVFNNIKKGQQIVRARGTLNMVVTVSPEGKALDVADRGGVGGPNAAQMSQFAQSVLLMTKFKPAVCSGKPCKSEFPFQLALN
jgi:hypothetical protein